MQMIRMGVFALLLVAFAAVGGKYAVLVSAGRSTVDNAMSRSAYWYGLYLAYECLIQHGYKHEDVTVLYDTGEDFVSKYRRFRNPWQLEVSSITDTIMTPQVFRGVLDSLGRNVVTDDDTMVVWWAVGHGLDEGPDSWGYDSCVDYYSAWWHNQNGHGTIHEDSLADWIDLVADYKLRLVFWQTCNAGGLLDGLTLNDSSLAMASVQFHHRSASIPDTISGQTPGDTVFLPGITQLGSMLMNRFDHKGRQSNADTSDDGLTALSELKAAIDSMYQDSVYLQLDDYGDSVGCYSLVHYHRPMPYDTSQIGGAIDGLRTHAIVDSLSPHTLRFLWRGEARACITPSGFLVLRDTLSMSRGAGLCMGDSVVLDTTGALYTGIPLRANEGVWLDSTGTLSDGLSITNPGGTTVVHIDDGDTTRARGWPAAEHPEL